MATALPTSGKRKLKHSNSDNPSGSTARLTFSGHETFHCRSLWLKKGYDFQHVVRNLQAIVQPPKTLTLFQFFWIEKQNHEARTM